MNKRFTAFLLSGLTLLAFASRAQTPVPAPTPAAASSSWTFTPAFVSQYMLRGVRLGGPSFEPNLEFDSGAFALGLWTNFPLKDKVAGFSDPEIDPYGSYAFNLITDKLTLQPGCTLYTYPRAQQRDGFYSLTVEPSLALNWMPAAGLKLTPKIYRDVVLKQTLLEFNAACSIPLPGAGTELDFLGTVGTFKATDAFADATPTVKKWGNYWLVGATMPFQLSMGTQKLLLGFAYTKGSANFIKRGNSPQFSNPMAVARGVISISYAVTF